MLGKKKSKETQEDIRESLENAGEEARKGQEAKAILGNRFFMELLQDLQNGYEQLVVGLNPNETEQFTFFQTKKDALRDIRVNLEQAVMRGEEAEKLLTGGPKKRGIIN